MSGFGPQQRLYILDGKHQYLDGILNNYQKPVTPTWNTVQTLGVISILTSDKRAEFPEMESDFIEHVDHLLLKVQNAPYIVSIDRFAWGSNSDCGERRNAETDCLQTYRRR